MHRDQTETLGLGFGLSRSRSVSFSVSLGLGRSVKVSVISAEISVSVSEIVTFSANYARFCGCGYVCVCGCGWVGGWMSFGEDVGVRNVGSISNSDLTILWRKIAWLMVTKTENYRYLSRDDRARDREARSRYTPSPRYLDLCSREKRTHGDLFLHFSNHTRMFSRHLSTFFVENCCVFGVPVSKNPKPLRISIHRNPFLVVRS
jgi:hypothetical protein